MTDNSGVLSVDFLAGFTIFMISFIWIATMVPGLFIGLSAHTIDYDAVAYRTGVILAEDPGAIGPNSNDESSPWEFQPPEDVSRFGLAVSKETPNILDENKVKRFFCSTVFSYPDDYQKKAIFGDYPYRFNISLRTTSDNQFRSVGDIIPSEYGYIRRDVKIKGSSNATIGDAMIKARGYNNTENVTWNQFSIMINAFALRSGSVRDPRYQINLPNDKIIINITDLNTTRPNWNTLNDYPSGSTLTNVTFYQMSLGSTYLTPWPPINGNFIYEDGNTIPVPPPVVVRNNISMVFGPEFFARGWDPTSTMYVNLTFNLTPPSQFLNNTLTAPFDYNYDPANVTQPALSDAVMEVAVW